MDRAVFQKNELIHDILLTGVCVLSHLAETGTPPYWLIWKILKASKTFGQGSFYSETCKYRI